MRHRVRTTTGKIFATFRSPSPVSPPVPPKSDTVGTSGRAIPPGPAAGERLSSPATGREPAASPGPGGIRQPERNHRVKRAQALLVPGCPATTWPGTVPGSHLTSHPVEVLRAELAVRGKLPARGLVAGGPYAWIRHAAKTTRAEKRETPRSLRGRSTSTRLGEYASFAPNGSECVL